jgi:hypothetical protein
LKYYYRGDLWVKLLTMRFFIAPADDIGTSMSEMRRYNQEPGRVQQIQQEIKRRDEEAEKMEQKLEKLAQRKKLLDQLMIDLKSVSNS